MKKACCPGQLSLVASYKLQFTTFFVPRRCVSSFFVAYGNIRHLAAAFLLGGLFTGPLSSAQPAIFLEN